MGTISTGAAGLPAATTMPSYSGLPSGAVDRLRVAGIPEDVIGVADSAVNGTGNIGGSSYYPTTPTTAPTVPTAGAPVAPSAAPPAAPSAGSYAPSAADQPDPQYPGLLQSHVMVLRAIGTPDMILQQMSSSGMNFAYLDQYIQAEIMQNPEGWDQLVGNPVGTARSGLQQIMPGVQLPAPGQGQPGALPPSTPGAPGAVPGAAVPGAMPGAVPGAAPGAYPQQPGMMSGNGMLTTALVGGGALGIGVLGYKAIKNKKAAAMGAVESAQDAAQVARSAGQAETLGMTPAMAAASQGGHFANAAQLHQLQMGMPPGHEWVSLHGNAAMLYNLNPERTMLLEALNNAAKSGSLGSMVNLGKGENALEGMERLLSALSKFK